MTERLLSLADQCEAAAGPNRRLDYQIYTAAVGAPIIWEPDDERYRYTASLEMAMALLPPEWDQMEVYKPDFQTLGWTVHVKQNANVSRDYWTGFAPTYELALCAAALRARATTHSEAEV